MYRRVMLLTLLIVLLLAGCAPSTSTPAPQTPAPDANNNPIAEVTVDPNGFVDLITNPYMPLSPGFMYIYEGTVNGQTEHTEIFVTYETRTVTDVVCVVVRETVSVNGAKVE